MTTSAPILLTHRYGRVVALEHLQSGCIVGVFRHPRHAADYAAMIRPWLRGVSSFADLSEFRRRALAVQLRQWYILYGYPEYSHCPCCNQWAILCERN
jgi:hypothetical protein